MLQVYCQYILIVRYKKAPFMAVVKNKGLYYCIANINESEMEILSSNLDCSKRISNNINHILVNDHIRNADVNMVMMWLLLWTIVIFSNKCRLYIKNVFVTLISYMLAHRKR